MAQEIKQRVFQKRSSVADKLPEDKSTVEYGELLVNYAAGKEFIGLKNSDNNYVRINAHTDAGDVTFNTESHADSGFTGTTVEDSIRQIESEIIKNEEVTSGSLNDLKSSIEDLPLGESNVIEEIQKNGVKLTVDSNKAVNIVVPDSADKITFDAEAHADSGFTATTVEKSIKDIEQTIIDNEEITSKSLNDLKTKIADNANVIEGIQVNGTDLSVSTDKKVNVPMPTKGSEISYDGEHPLTGLTGTTLTKAIGDIEQTIVDNELVVATALNDLDAKITDKSYSADEISFKASSHYGAMYMGGSKFSGSTVEQSIYDLEGYVNGLPDEISAKVDKKSVVTLLSGYTGMGTTTGSTSQSVTLDADTFYIIGRAGSLTIALPSSAATDCLEYCCQFYVPSDSFTLTMPDNIYWQNGSVPSFEASTCCQMIIINNCATIGAYKATS